MKKEFLNAIIAKEKDINDQIFWNRLKHQNLSFLGKDLIRATEAKNEQLAKNVNDALIDLRNSFTRK